MAGTMDIDKVARNAIKNYEERDALVGNKEQSRQETVYQSATVLADGEGVNAQRAAKVIESAINRYEEAKAKGVSSEKAIDEVAKDLSKQFDDTGRTNKENQQQEQQRSRGGLSL